MSEEASTAGDVRGEPSKPAPADLPLQGADACSKHIALMGLMGCGKTTVGRILSQQLGRPCLDLDVTVIERTGRTVQQLFEEGGEANFRALETEALKSVMDTAVPCVLALGGGAVLLEQNRLLLAEYAIVVWLRASVATLAGRVGSGAGRPLLTGGPVERLTILEQERRSVYTEAADFVIDVDDLRPSQVADGIRAMIDGSVQRSV